MNKKSDSVTIELMKQFETSDYELRAKFNRMDEASELIRRDGFGSFIDKDMPKPVRLKFSNDMFFVTRKNGLIPFFMAKMEEQKIVLYELTYEAYNRYGF